MQTKLFLALLFFLLGCTNTSTSANGIQPPFDIQSIFKDKGRKITAEYPCPSVPPHIENLYFTTIYTDRSEGVSNVDPEAKEEYKKAIQPLTDYENKVSNMADLFIESRYERKDIGRCALTWLHSWAKSGALEGDVNSMGEAVRKWSLASLASSYTKIKYGKGLNADQKKEIEEWLKRLGHTVKDDYSSYLHRATRQNNHLYWAAWGVMMAGVATQDKSLFDWSVEKYRYGIGQIQGDGTLPQEMARMKKAYNYHIFATAPLVMMAETGARNGLDLYGEKNGALHKLVGMIVNEVPLKGKTIGKITGRTQDLTGTLEPRQFGWLEPYYARFPSPAIYSIIKEYRPMKQRRTGGDMTLLYGVPLD